MLEGIHRVRFNKPLHYPDVIGGHFKISNTELLLKSYDSEFLQLILWSNEERKKRRLRMKSFMQKLRRLGKEQKFFKRS
jgi:hypothetical protein